MKSTFIIPNFYSRANQLKKIFDAQFLDPYSTHSKRFVWDYWYVPNQYCLHRTPAYHYFPQKLYVDFEQQLIHWGKENLGCVSISSPWISYYVDGNFQDLHSDNPHGPFAFVFSLTNWSQRTFQGGETLIANELLLKYWQNLNLKNSHEGHDFFKKIPPKFNQLTVFDPRLPHGVKEVRGEKNPINSRIVIHGWFTEPRVFFEGSHANHVVEKLSHQVLKYYMDYLSEFNFNGLATLRLKIYPSGKVKFLKVCVNMLRDPNGNGISNSKLEQLFLKNENILSVVKSSHQSTVTVPIYLSTT